MVSEFIANHCGAVWRENSAAQGAHSRGERDILRKGPGERSHSGPEGIGRKACQARTLSGGCMPV